MSTLTKSPVTDETSIMVLNVFRFVYNFNPVVFDRTWPPATDQIIYEHFLAKWKNICASEGFASANALMRFLGELDKRNQHLFSKSIAEYIAENYR